MNKLYEAIAKAIRMNTYVNASRRIDKSGLVIALSDYFEKTDTLFNSTKFVEACDKISD